MEPQPVQVSEFFVLFRSGGTVFLVISGIGVLLTAIGVLGLFKNVRPLILAGTIVAVLVFIATMFFLQNSYTKFFELAISGATPDPNEIAETIMFSIAIGFCSLCSTTIPLSLFVFGLVRHSANSEPTNSLESTNEHNK